MADYTEHYHRIEVALTDLMQRADVHLSVGERAEAAEFLDHKEYGLALETLSAIMLESGRNLSRATLAVIESAALEMGMADQPVIVDLLEVSTHRSAAAS